MNRPMCLRVIIRETRVSYAGPEKYLALAEKTSNWHKELYGFDEVDRR